MKHARKTLLFLILLVTPLLLAGVLPPALDNEVEATITPITTKINLPSYDVQTPILAYSDFDMDNYASALSWDGDGSSGDPYIIEGYNITDDGDCLLMWDVSRAFEIRNCYISSFGGNHGNGIIIYNVSQAAVIDTVIRDKSDAMIVTLTPSPYFDNCTIFDCGTGLDMAACPGASINDCHIYDIFGEAIRFIDCNNTLISENEIHDTIVGSGIQFHLSYDVIVVNNEISFCESSGVWVVNSPRATIENNVIHDNEFFTGPMCGIHIENSDYASIIGNEIYHNAVNGIYIELSDWAYIFDNEIYANSDHGIDIVSSSNGTILQNDIHGNGWWAVMTNSLCGIYLGFTYDWVISENTIWNNTPSGISLYFSETTEILNNEIFNNTDNGIYGIMSEGDGELRIISNEIYGNGHSIGTGGIILYNYKNCTIDENVIYNNTGSGILSHGPDNNITSNVVYDTIGKGINIEMTNDNLVLENWVYDNTEAGIFLYAGTTDVIHNIVHDNEVGIHLYGSSSCNVYGNDIGWNDVNALQEYGQPNNVWYATFDDFGNHWHDHVPPTGEGIDRYAITNGTHSVAFDNKPDMSLNMTTADPISYEILETGNVLSFEAYALNPSHYEVFVDGASVLEAEWDGGNIEYNADGLAHGTHTIAIEVYHISGHSMENGTTAGVEDLTDPSAIAGPALVELTVGDTLSAQYSSEDPSGIEWTVNNTVDFAISSTGLLTSVTDLAAGEYVVRITVTDPYGHSTALDVTITVTVVDAGLPTELILAIGGGSVIVILIIGGLVYKTKKG